MGVGGYTLYGSPNRFVACAPCLLGDIQCFDGARQLIIMHLINTSIHWCNHSRIAHHGGMALRCYKWHDDATESHFNDALKSD